MTNLFDSDYRNSAGQFRAKRGDASFAGLAAELTRDRVQISDRISLSGEIFPNPKTWKAREQLLGKCHELYRSTVQLCGFNPSCGVIRMTRYNDNSHLTTVPDACNKNRLARSERMKSASRLTSLPFESEVWPEWSAPKLGQLSSEERFSTEFHYDLK